MRDRQCSVTSIPKARHEQGLSTTHSDYSCMIIIRFLPLLTPSCYPSFPSLLLRFAKCPTPLCASFTEFQTERTIYRNSSNIFLLLAWGLSVVRNPRWAPVIHNSFHYLNCYNSLMLLTMPNLSSTHSTYRPRRGPLP